MSDNGMTNETAPKFDFAAYPADTLFHERRSGTDRRLRGESGAPGVFTPLPQGDRRRKERRRRIDPTTFEKDYSAAELEFMNAMQRFKDRSAKPFPSHRDVLKVAVSLGYRKAVWD